MRDQTDQRAFELADVGANVRRDVKRDVGGKGNFFPARPSSGELATLVSRSGGWMSYAISPYSKRLRRRSSDLGEFFGRERSLAITICFIDSCSALNVWKNSSWVRSLPVRNWISSIPSRTSVIVAELIAEGGHLMS